MGDKESARGCSTGLVVSSPVLGRAVRRLARSARELDITCSAYSWHDFSTTLRAGGRPPTTVLLDAFLDDWVPLALKIRVLARLGTRTVVLGSGAATPLAERARLEGAVGWVEPTVGLDTLVRLVERPGWPADVVRPSLLGVELTDRQIQVLCAYASRRGLSPGQFARVMGVSAETMRSHLRSGRRRFTDRGVDVSSQALLIDALVADGYLVPESRWRAEGRW
ncbi:helix-turn-helix domain-containing protein [Luteipulveratus halotolerans]|uniref:Uncharacterized protein n=1 Tax=Luteipulveratus halotolerans TaxID=1631356 RepID=A0A0L6CES3_9MICO|nr:response regulator transcription factor [Luteipulveratus halotolerans]KNX36189.1 hypothetical protein VV01_01950 [Luteipulveratus halotolerans]